MKLYTCKTVMIMHIIYIVLCIYSNVSVFVLRKVLNLLWSIYVGIIANEPIILIVMDVYTKCC